MRYTAWDVPIGAPGHLRRVFLISEGVRHRPREDNGVIRTAVRMQRRSSPGFEEAEGAMGCATAVAPGSSHLHEGRDLLKLDLISLCCDRTSRPLRC